MWALLKDNMTKWPVFGKILYRGIGLLRPGTSHNRIKPHRPAVGMNRSCLSSALHRLQRRTMYATLAYPKSTGQPMAVPKPSSSIVLISPVNELLLLHRVKTSSAFPSAHVFPGGALSEFHERVPDIDSPARHIDGPDYRIAAIRETFEESGILLARKKGHGGGKESAHDDHKELLQLPDDVLEQGRTAIHGDKTKFTEWLSQHGGEPDVGKLHDVTLLTPDGLIPFTRWITPPTLPKRFTVQMYLYFLPLSSSSSLQPTHDGGLEHTAAEFEPLQTWLKRGYAGDIVLYEPQAYIIGILGQFLTPGGDYAAQRNALRAFATSPPLGPDGTVSRSPAGGIAWSDKVMCPYVAKASDDGRAILSCESPGPELEGTDRGGDYDRVVIIRSWDKTPREVEVRWRRDVLGNEDVIPKSRM